MGNTYITRFNTANVYHDIFKYSVSGYYGFVTMEMAASPNAGADKDQILYMDFLEEKDYVGVVNGYNYYKKTVVYSGKTYVYEYKEKNGVVIYSQNGIVYPYFGPTYTKDGVAYPQKWSTFPLNYRGKIRFKEYFLETRSTPDALMQAGYAKLIQSTNKITEQFKAVVLPAKARYDDATAKLANAKMTFTTTKSYLANERSEKSFELDSAKQEIMNLNNKIASENANLTSLFSKKNELKAYLANLQSGLISI